MHAVGFFFIHLHLSEKSGLNLTLVVLINVKTFSVYMNQKGYHHMKLFV